jgi:hypothetical protein
MSGKEMTEMCHGCLDGKRQHPSRATVDSLARGGLGENLLPLAIFFVDGRHVARR